MNTEENVKHFNEEEAKPLLDELKEINQKEGFIPLKTVEKMFIDYGDDYVDEVIDYLTEKGYEIQADESMDGIDLESIDDDELDLEDMDDEFLEEEESEIKVSDFDINESATFQSDDLVRMYLHEIGQVDLLTITQELEFARQVQDGLMAEEKLAQCEKNGKKLSPEELKELNHKVNVGKDAQDVLIQSNLRLVVSIARRYTNRGLELPDLIQEGNIGLSRAVLKYDPTRGFKFSTYATWWIRQAIARAIADKGRNVRIPVHMHECISSLSRTKRRLTQELHREPTQEELAKEMGKTVDEIVQLQRYSQDSISFDSTIGDDEDSTLIDLVPDENTLNPLEYTEKSLFREEMDDVLQTLTPREEMVIRLRYGINVNRSHTLEEVGKIMGITRERVRQIETKAILRLRHHQRLGRLKQHIDFK